MLFKKAATTAILAGLLACSLDAQILQQPIAESDDYYGLDLSKDFYQQSADGWWTKRYLLDYALVAGGFTGYLIGKDLVPRQNSMIGPSYEPGNLERLFEFDSIGKTYLDQDVEESVPEYWIHRAIAGSGVFLIGMEWREMRNGRGSPQQLHDTFIGFAEAVAVNAAFTELLKPVFARLRPDFRERALRFHCPGSDPDQYGEICDGFRDMPLHEDPNEARDLLEDGRKSFYSGHSSNSFALFGYSALAIGGRYVWGADTSRQSRIVGITTQTGAIAFATYISASRVSDGRHFTSDTVVGATAGLAIANISYWRRFNRQGELRSQNRQNTYTQDAGFRERAEVTMTPWAYTFSGSSGLRLNITF